VNFQLAADDQNRLQAGYRDNFQWLQDIKVEYDPHNLFRFTLLRFTLLKLHNLHVEWDYTLLRCSAWPWLVLAAVSIAVVLGIVLGLLSSYWVSSPVRWPNLFWSYALSRAPASLVASFLYVPSALTILIAWVWLREVPTALTVVGGRSRC